MRRAGNILVDHFFLFANTQKETEEGEKGRPIALRISPEQYNIPVERLELSSRTLNCLKRANINKVGEVLEMKRSDLLQIRNFGTKSLDELYDRLRENDLLPAELDPDIAPEETEVEADEAVAEAGDEGMAEAVEEAVEVGENT